ncbi:thioredoxin [Candidatus Saganbacteria bacterium]|nr:thioredoxin [Candidatus Saganbacteria bacterium]
MAKEITDSQFAAEVTEHKGVAFVDFWAPWCGPCVMMSPIFEKMVQKFPQIKFLKINTNEYSEQAGKLGITSIPCIIVFKEGKEAERLIGFRPEPAMEAAVKKYLSN